MSVSFTPAQEAPSDDFTRAARALLATERELFGATVREVRRDD